MRDLVGILFHLDGGKGRETLPIRTPSEIVYERSFVLHERLNFPDSLAALPAER